jgi:hypothetical protein
MILARFFRVQIGSEVTISALSLPRSMKLPALFSSTVDRAVPLTGESGGRARVRKCEKSLFAIEISG